MNRLPFALAACALSAGYVLVTPLGAKMATRSIELPTQGASGQEKAIVLLSGSMSRLPATIALQSRTQLPVIVSGAYSKDYLLTLQRANVVELLAENRSTDTEENAAYSSCQIKATGLQPVFLVTDAVHMRRSIAWFNYYGVPTTAAPIAMRLTGGLTPSISAAKQTIAVLREWLGILEFSMLRLVGRVIPC